MVFTTRNLPRQMREERPASLWTGLQVSTLVMLLTLAGELAIYLRSGQAEWHLIPAGTGVALFCFIYLTIRSAMLKMPNL